MKVLKCKRTGEYLHVTGAPHEWASSSLPTMFADGLTIESFDEYWKNLGVTLDFTDVEVVSCTIISEEEREDLKKVLNDFKMAFIDNGRTIYDLRSRLGDAESLMKKSLPLIAPTNETARRIKQHLETPLVRYTAEEKEIRAFVQEWEKKNNPFFPDSMKYREHLVQVTKEYASI